MSCGKKIILLPGMARAEQFSTLVHELAHELLHRDARRSQTTQRVRETEGEAVVFVVSKGIGLDTNSAAEDYISLYSGNAALLLEPGIYPANRESDPQFHRHGESLRASRKLTGIECLVGIQEVSG
jgi:hypothetical protein